MIKARHIDDLDKSRFKAGDILRRRVRSLSCYDRVIISVEQRGLVVELLNNGGHRMLMDWPAVYYYYDTTAYEKEGE